MSMHESQSKLWENHVARNPAFAEVLAAELAAGGFAVDAPPSCTRRSWASQPSVDPRVRRSAHLPAAHHPALRARARADRRRARRRRPARRVARRHAPPARRRGSLRRARLPAGRALGRRQLRLLPQLRARLPDRRAAVGGDGGRARAARGGSARGRGGSDPALAGASTCTATGDASTRCRWSSRRPGAAWRSSRSCATSLRSPKADAGRESEPT